MVQTSRIVTIIRKSNFLLTALEADGARQSYLYRIIFEHIKEYRQRWNRIVKNGKQNIEVCARTRTVQCTDAEWYIVCVCE